MSLKSKLRAGRLTLGSWVTLGHPSIPEIMLRAGFEWLTVDMEHSAIDLPQAQQLMQIISLGGAAALVRVGENDPTIIKRVMDAGAAGVIVPMVNSRADAEKAVKSVQYPPAGFRGVGLARAQGYGQSFEAYKAWNRHESVVIAQIEHIRAIENLEEILSVPGIDGTIIGPYDLSSSLGFPGEFHRKEVSAALKRYEKVCRKLRKPMGIHVVQPDPAQVKRYAAKGYSFIAVGVDFLYLGDKCLESMRGLAPRS
ncbi:MAG: aldolase/citrate lyase family protein [Elusimicrobia bacterium]|nr:aldolase/citrate lyase family protein [Elusimicrobiota bacterium]